MTLLEFATKYQADAYELLEMLIFEGFPINNIDDEIDDRLTKHLLEVFGSKRKHNKKKNIYKNNIVQKKTDTNDNVKFEKKFLYKDKMIISECIETSGCSAANIINFFIKNGKLYSMQTVLSINEVLEFAIANNINVIDRIHKASDDMLQNILSAKSNETGSFYRNPIVTIVGHVDHGKTTLLDKIRKENVAKNEKGGITQHIGAYEIEYNNKCITFLDTPGHEAFNALRKRGITIADIGILVIAADDGLKPQSIESIKILQELKIQIIVAITKIDKKGRKSTDSILSELNQYGIVCEAWGGNTPVVEVSAFSGLGIAELLENIILISDLSELKTSIDIDAYGFILETKKDKGLGFISTIILQRGLLNIGDAYFTSSTWGKIIVAYDSKFQKVNKLYPGKPYLINGFAQLPLVGSFIQKASLLDARKRSAEYNLANEQSDKNYIFINNNISKSRIFNIIVKGDVSSSLQAIEKSLEKYITDEDFYFKPNIILSGIGDIVENDINMAIHAKAAIYGFNINKITNPNLLDILKINNIEVNYFDVIYSLFDDLESKIKKEKNNEPELIQIGELKVLKLFNIKTVGLIIGFRVLNGKVKLGALGKVYSNNEYIGKGQIKSLEKDKYQVKELTKDHEGALSLHGITNIQENDIIEIYFEK